MDKIHGYFQFFGEKNPLDYHGKYHGNYNFLLSNRFEELLI
jgi:hypothetical protein